MWQGLPETAIEHLQTAMRLSPADPHMFTMHGAMAAAHFLAGRYPDAIAWAARSAWAKPEFAISLAVMAASYALSDRPDEARDAMVRLMDADPGLCRANLADRFPLRRAEDLVRWTGGLTLAGLGS